MNTDINGNSKTGEKAAKGFFSYHRFLEENSSLTYQIRSLIESGFRVKKEAARQELNSNGKTLDFACGEGFMRYLFHPENYFGIDISQKVLNGALKHGPAKLALMNGTSLGFRSDSFDNIIAFDCFHHIENDLSNRITREINRILKPGGCFLVTDPIRDHFFKNPLNKLMQTLDRGNYFRSIEELAGLLSENLIIKKQYVGKSSFISWQIYVLSKKS